jgi:hypothetical protein
MSITTTALGLRVSACVLFGVVLGVPVNEAPAQTAPESFSRINSRKATPEQRRKRYWSPVRIRDAKPFPLPQVDPTTLRTRPKRTAGTDVAPVTSKDLRPPRARVSGNVATKPLKWAGKFNFTTSDGDMVCSAQFITDDVILTAAHCVRDRDTGDYYDNFEFLLQYDNGDYLERYGWDCVATMDGWVEDEGNRWRWDYAMLRVDGSSSVGNFGWHHSWPSGRYSEARKIGYPVDIRRGRVIQIERGPISVESDLVEMRHGNPKSGGGSSGGAWVGNYTSGGGSNNNYIISVTSFSYNGRPDIDYGPYIDSDFRKLLDYVQGGC